MQAVPYLFCFCPFRLALNAGCPVLILFLPIQISITCRLAFLAGFYTGGDPGISPLTYMQLIFLRKSDYLGCAVLLCLVFFSACFFLPSFSSLIKTSVYSPTLYCSAHAYIVLFTLLKCPVHCILLSLCVAPGRRHVPEGSA